VSCGEVTTFEAFVGIYVEEGYDRELAESLGRSYVLWSDRFGYSTENYVRHCAQRDLAEWRREHGRAS
jgi:hypothetical protein